MPEPHLDRIGLLTIPQIFNESSYTKFYALAIKLVGTARLEFLQIVRIVKGRAMGGIEKICTASNGPMGGIEKLCTAKT